MNYYVLYCQTLKTEKVCLVLNRKKHIHAFIPKMEKWIRVKNEVVLQVMFPGYLFIKTKLTQEEFDSLLFSMNEERDGIIKELKKEDVSALTKQEISILNHLLNDEAIMVMSKGYKENGKTVVTDGPLVHFQRQIVDSDKRDMIAVLDIEFLQRKIKAGLFFR